MYPISIFNDDFFDSIFKDFMPTLNNHSFSFDDAFPPINLYMNSKGESNFNIFPPSLLLQDTRRIGFLLRLQEPQ